MKHSMIQFGAVTLLMILLAQSLIIGVACGITAFFFGRIVWSMYKHTSALTMQAYADFTAQNYGKAMWLGFFALCMACGAFLALTFGWAIVLFLL